MPRFLFSDKELVNSLRKIPDGSVIAISGFNISIAPEYIMLKLYEAFEKTGHPNHIFIESDSLPGSPGRGIDYISKEVFDSGSTDFLAGVLVPFLGWAPWLQKLINEDMIEGYTCSIGSMAHWFRETAAGRPGLLTKVGLGTFLDSEHDAGALNGKAREKKRVGIETVNLKGEDYLFVTAPKPNVSLVRGTTSDEIGNISMEKEGIYGTVFSITQASKATPNPGIVFCQVERIARFGTINPKAVHIPGPLIDYVTIAPPEFSWQTDSIEFDPRISGGIIPPQFHRKNSITGITAKNIILRRSALEITKEIQRAGRPLIANFGVGIPSEIPGILDSENISDYIYSTVEAGPWGGIPLTGDDFGVSIGPFAIIPLPDQFTLYEGGMIDVAALGFMQIDREGNVNPSMLPGRTPGPGGFPTITNGSPSIIFAGQFTAGKSDIKIENGSVKITKDGDTVKFVQSLYKVLFRSDIALRNGKRVIYVTERAVFELTSKGLALKEIAPGIDIDRDVIDKMAFKPHIQGDVSMMDRRIFVPRKIGLHPMIKGIKKGNLSES